MKNKTLKQIEFCKNLIGKKGKEVLEDGYDKYGNLEVYGYKFYNESPNPYIVFKCKDWKAKLISAICFKGYPICNKHK